MDNDDDQHFEQWDLRNVSSSVGRRQREGDPFACGGTSDLGGSSSASRSGCSDQDRAARLEELGRRSAAIIQSEQAARRGGRGQARQPVAALVHVERHAARPADSSATRLELPEPSPAPAPPTVRNSLVGTPFAGHPAAQRYRRDADGAVRSVRTGRSASVQKWEFYSYDNEWATRGLPFTSNLLPPGVEYICGQPERNTTTAGDGTPKQHFQGFVAFAAPRTAVDVGAILGLTQCSPIPVGNEMVHERIKYTKKEESAVRDAQGRSMWREAGVLPDNLKRRGDKHTEIVECVRNGGTEMDVLNRFPQMGIQYLGNITRMVGIYSRPEDRPDLQVYLIFGKTRVGKSHFVRRILQDGDNSPVFNKPHPASPTAVDFWPLNYNGATRVLFDDWHPKKYNITDMLNYLQEYAMSVQVKGGYTAAKWNRVYITTNVPIDSWYDHLPESYSGNIEALKARIPEANRMVMRRRPPPEMSSTTFQEMKAYQDGFAEEDKKETKKQPIKVDEMDVEQMRALLKRIVGE